MEQMKLYTEEQVNRAIELARTDDVYYPTKDEIVDALTPIKLPSKEEIITASLPILVGSSHSSEYIKGFNDGAKWVIDQIKQQVDGKNQ